MAMGRKTRSRCSAETAQGTHVFEICDYTMHRGLGVGKFLSSATFSVGGYDWCLYFYPDGFSEEDRDYVAVIARLLTKNIRARACISFKLVDQKTGHLFSPHERSEPHLLDTTTHGNRVLLCCTRFMERGELESSSYIRDDRLALDCVVTMVVGDPRTTTPHADDDDGIRVPPSDITAHLGKLLESKTPATDVTFEVGGEEFHAHKLLLAARSPVFQVELYGPMKEKNMSRIAIGGIQPEVFRALLHFVYTDSLPADVDDLGGDDEKEMARNLLEAADRYAMDRLKLVCESTLAKTLDAESVSLALALADQHNCAGLKVACFRFIAFSCEMEDVEATKAYGQLKRSCPSALLEMWEKTSRLRKM